MENRVFKTCLFLIFAISLSITSTAQRKSKIYVKNNTGKTIYNVTILHKYSNNYKDKKTHKSLKPKQTSSYFNARYNTGFGTTGKDWWIVSWVEIVNNKQIRHRITNPKNGRAFIDGFEKGFKSSFNIGSSLMNKYAGDIYGLKGQIAAAAGDVINKKLIKKTMNNSSTKGFKQHILRSEDKKMTIVLYSNGKVLFKSKSGNSTTYTKSTVFTPKTPKAKNHNSRTTSIQKNKYYKLKSAKNNKYLTTKGINKHLGYVYQETKPNNGGYWVFIKVGNNYRIYNTKSKNYLANLQNKKPGIPMRQVKNPGNGALWKVTPKGNKFYIKNAQSGLYLSFYNSKFALQTKRVFNLWYLEK